MTIEHILLCVDEIWIAQIGYLLFIRAYSIWLDINEQYCHGDMTAAGLLRACVHKQDDGWVSVFKYA